MINEPSAQGGKLNHGIHPPPSNARANETEHRQDPRLGSRGVRTLALSRDCYLSASDFKRTFG